MAKITLESKEVKNDTEGTDAQILMEGDETNLLILAIGSIGGSAVLRGLLKTALEVYEKMEKAGYNPSRIISEENGLRKESQEEKIRRQILADFENKTK